MDVLDHVSLHGQLLILNIALPRTDQFQPILILILLPLLLVNALLLGDRGEGLQLIQERPVIELSKVVDISVIDLGQFLHGYIL